jgi:hypothetical protein
MRDTSLDDFFASDESDEPAESEGEHDDADADADADDECDPTGSGDADADVTKNEEERREPPAVEPATVTSRVPASKEACAACGESVGRLWREDGEDDAERFVCASCREW